MRTAGVLLCTVALLFGCRSGPSPRTSRSGIPANTFEMTGSGSVPIPGGGRGDIYWFMAYRLDRPVRIVYFLDGEETRELAVLEGIPTTDFAMVIIPEDEEFVRAYAGGDATEVPVREKDRESPQSGSMHSVFAQPAPDRGEKTCFWRWEVTYADRPGAEECETHIHELHLLYGEPPGLRGAPQEPERRLSIVGGGGGYEGEKSEYEHVYMKRYADTRDELVVAVLTRTREFDLVPLRLNLRYEYDGERGGRLAVNGEWVDQNDRPQLWVNGPYGSLVRVPLSDEDRSRLSKADEEQGFDLPSLRQLWQDLVDPALYRYEGQRVDGQKHGPWTVKLADGSLYMQGAYDKGRRTGDWSAWYPDGAICARAAYRDDELDGQWVVFDESGKVLLDTRWQRGRPLDEPVRWRGMTDSKTVYPDGTAGGSSGP